MTFFALFAPCCHDVIANDVHTFEANIPLTDFAVIRIFIELLFASYTAENSFIIVAILRMIRDPVQCMTSITSNINFSQFLLVGNLIARVA